MKSRDNSILIDKKWAEKLVDFLLGPSPHSIYMASAAAGFSGANQRSSIDRASPARRVDSDGSSAQVALAAYGMSSYFASNSSQGSEGGRR